MVHRIVEEVAAWRSFGCEGAEFEAGLMDLKKAYPAANKTPFWKILVRHGVDPQGPYSMRFMVSILAVSAKLRPVRTCRQHF